MVSWRIIRYIATHQEKWDALDRALVYCINHGIFPEFLREKRREISRTLWQEWELYKYERSLRGRTRTDG